MSYRSRLAESSLVIVSCMLAISCGGGQAEAPPAEAPPAPVSPPVAEAPPAQATSPAATPAPEPAAAAQPAEPAPAASGKHPHHGRGMAQLFVVSLAKLDLKADQKATVDAASEHSGFVPPLGRTCGGPRRLPCGWRAASVRIVSEP